MIRTDATPLRLASKPIERAAPDNRLAELVAHLTGCAPRTAVRAVDDALPAEHQQLSVDDRLGVVARALVVVKHEQVDLRSRRPA
jgi:hypothetical protein